MAKKTTGFDGLDQSKEYVTKHIANSEKAMDGLIEYNAALFKGAETLVQRTYENYISNVAASFDGMKSLNKVNDVQQFYKVAAENMASATERVSEQMKDFSELATKVAKDTDEAGRATYTKSFTGNL